MTKGSGVTWFLTFHSYGTCLPGGGRWRWLREVEEIDAAIRYVVDGQGAAMAVFEAVRGR